MTNLDTTRLGKLLALAGSDHDGEALNALRKANGMLKAAGLSFTDIGEKLKGPKAVQFEHTPWPAREPPKPKSYTAGGCTWPSKAAYEAYCAREAVQREAERQRHAPRRAAVLEKYGSEVAAIARDQREQALHDAAAPWLEGPHVPEPKYGHLAGRWHDSMGGWKRYNFGKHPPEACRAAIEAAYPTPTTIREARDEVRYWDQRDDELCHAIEWWGDEQLDLPASYRRELVRKLYESELPIVTMDDLHLRLQFAVETNDRNDVCRAAPSNLDAFERLVMNATPAPTEPSKSNTPTSTAERRRAVLALLSNSDTAALSDREIGRRVGVSPSTVSALRRKLTFPPVASG